MQERAGQARNVRAYWPEANRLIRRGHRPGLRRRRLSYARAGRGSGRAGHAIQRARGSAGKGRVQMAVSSGRLVGLRVALAVAGVMDLFFGAGFLVAPRSMLDAFGFGGEPLTTVLRSAFALGATLSICWAVAIAIALRDPLGNRGLIQAVIFLQVFSGVIGFYFDVFVNAQGGAGAIDVLTLALGLIVLALYPWRAPSVYEERGIRVT